MWLLVGLFSHKSANPGKNVAEQCYCVVNLWSEECVCVCACVREFVCELGPSLVSSSLLSPLVLCLTPCASLQADHSPTWISSCGD
jgi:hypothetical protein